MKPSFNRQYHKNELKADERFEFQVETDPAIMKRLSDDVYEDPISAILRELATNAYDAHIDANNQDVPFDIDLPIGSNADFRIRDYGTGLSKEDFHSLGENIFHIVSFQLVFHDKWLFELETCSAFDMEPMSKLLEIDVF